jgi:glycosyltransferase involved in cell wall biosynthesis
MSIEISLIVSTYGRYSELDSLLESFSLQDVNSDLFEVIVVDQNDKLDLAPLIVKYNQLININHCKVTAKGLSKAKNKGIDLAKGRVLTFPDDDCKFYPDTISKALVYLANNPGVEVVYGKVFDRQTGLNVMRNWSNDEKRLSLLNFSLNYSAITCFTRLKLRFDENYGVGSPIASGEELDYVIRAIESGCQVAYTPVIEVWHPELNVLSMTSKKAYNYAYGYGAIMRKNVNLLIFFTFGLSLCYQGTRFLLSIFSKDSSKYFMAIKGRIYGFFKI